MHDFCQVGLLRIMSTFDTFQFQQETRSFYKLNFPGFLLTAKVVYQATNSLN